MFLRKFIFILIFFSIFFSGCISKEELLGIDQSLRPVKIEIVLKSGSPTKANMLLKGASYNRIYKIDIPGTLEIKVKPSDTMYEATFEWVGSATVDFKVYVDGVELSSPNDIVSVDDIMQFRVSEKGGEN